MKDGKEPSVAGRESATSVRALEFGDELPPLRLTLSQEEIAEFVHAANQAAPRFLSDDGGRADGLPGQIAPGNMSLALFSRLLEGATAGAAVRRISATFRSFVQPRVPLIVSGVVTDVEEDGDGKLLHCDVLLETEAGDRLVTGTGTIHVADSTSGTRHRE